MRIGVSPISPAENYLHREDHYHISSPPSPKQASAKPSAAVESVPLLDLRRQYNEIRRRCWPQSRASAIRRALFWVQDLRHSNAKFLPSLERRKPSAALAGTEALWLALIAAGVKLPGDSVITTPFSFLPPPVPSCRARRNSGFCGPWTPTPESRRKSRTTLPSVILGLRPVISAPRTCALFFRYIFTASAPISTPSTTSQEFGVAIVEDAAQAIGAEWNGRGAGSLGVAAAFSFYPTREA